MSKLQLISELQTVVKMAAKNEAIDEVKLALYMDDLLSNYTISQNDEWDDDAIDDNLVRMYLNALKIENYSANTLLGYGYQLARFAEHVQKPLLKVKTADVRQYLAANDHLKVSTVVTKLNIISSFYAWLVIEEELLKNPCDKIKRPRQPKKVREGLTVIELEQVRNACKDARQRALIEFMYSTGCRLDEIRKLNIDDIDWHNQSLLVNGKGNKDRRVYLSDKAAWYLEKYLETRDDECEALFATERQPIRRLSRHGIYNQVRKIKEQCDEEMDKTLYPHKMRHTFAQLNLDNGMEIADLQALMGHVNPATTLRYAEVSEERKQAAFRKHHMQ